MGNLLIVKNADFSQSSFMVVNDELLVKNYTIEMQNTNYFQIRSGGNMIYGLNTPSLNGITIVGVKLLITTGFSGTDGDMKIYYFNATEKVEIGSIPFSECVGKTEVLVPCTETLCDGEHYIGVGNMNVGEDQVTLPVCGIYSGGTSKRWHAADGLQDNPYTLFFALYKKIDD